MSTLCRNVIVLGSKPKPSLNVIGEEDFVVCVNGAIHLKDDFAAKKVIHVISDFLLGESESQLVCKARNAMAGKVVDELIVFQSKYAVSEINALAENLKGIGYSFDELIVISRLEKIAIYFSGIGWHFFVFLKRLGLIVFAKEVYGMFRYRTPRVTKPSSGIYAYLYCRKRYAGSVVSCIGVGLDNDGYSYIKGKFDRGHMLYDSMVIDRHRRVFFDL